MKNTRVHKLRVDEKELDVLHVRGVKIDVNVPSRTPTQTPTTTPTTTPTPTITLTPTQSPTQTPTKTPTPTITLTPTQTPPPPIVLTSCSSTFAYNPDDKINLFTTINVPTTECHDLKYSVASPIEDWWIQQYYMMIFLGGVHIADVDYPETREGETFEYRIENSTTGVITSYFAEFSNYDDTDEVNLT